jgi:MbtH protein
MDELRRYTVLRNEEDQYGLYPVGRALPDGWRETGVTGSEEDCVNWVDQHWTDMRPLSLRRATGPDKP